jgi:hypothetical protein
MSSRYAERERAWEAHKNRIFQDVIKEGIPKMITWLDTIKRNTWEVKYGSVKSPISDDEFDLEVYPDTGKYAIILEWCIKNIPDYDYDKIPLPYNFVIPAKPNRPVQPAASIAASSVSAATDISTESILKWLKDPSRDENGESIEVALNEDSKYYKLYSSSFKYLYKQYNPLKTPLTKELYKKIQQRLPITHIYDFQIKETDISVDTIYTYDHLMMKCISDNKISLTDKEAVDYKFFIEEYDIFEEIYLRIDRLLKNPITQTNDISTLLLSHLDTYMLYYFYGERLFEYVACIKSFDKKQLHQLGKTIEETYKNIEKDKIKIKLYNFIASKSTPSMYSADTLISKYKTLKHFSQGTFFAVVLREEVFASKNNEEIFNFLKTAIYDISELYEEAKIDVDEYLPISEDETVAPPLFPSPPAINNDITRYNMIMAQIKEIKSKNQGKYPRKSYSPESPDRDFSAIKKKAFSTSPKKFVKEDLYYELEEYKKRLAAFDNPEFKAMLNEHKTKTKNYKVSVQKYESDVKKYKKDVLGKSSPPKKDVLGKSSPPNLKKSSMREERLKCVNDKDPITQEAFDDMSQKKLDNMTKIITNITTSDNKKEKIVTCYDTIPLYNYILSCYYKNIVPENIGMGRGSLTIDNMNQVKRKIKHFTSNKTLPLIIIDNDKKSSDSKKNKKVFGKLIEIYIDTQENKRLANNISGFYEIKLRIKIGGIHFKIFDEKYNIIVPIISGDSERESREIPMITNIYDEILKKQKSGNLFVTNYFPYRRGREFIMRVPKFEQMLTNNSIDILIEARIRYYNDLILM